MNEQLEKARADYLDARKAFDELGVVQESPPLNYASGAEMLERGAALRNALDQYMRALEAVQESSE